MPLTNPEDAGTEKDGTPSVVYCIYCYKEGHFTSEVSMDEMIDHCAGYLVEYNKDAEQELTLEQAKARMREVFPKLKRWSGNA